MRHQRHKNHGFTLLEILLAVFIFSLISIGAYQIFSIAQKNAISIQAAQERLHDISLSFELIEKDLTQVVARTWRDPYSDASNPPLQTSSGDDFVIRMIRGGWRNPLGQARSGQQLVTYRLQDDKLQRSYNLHLDNISSTKEVAVDLVDRVVSVELSFIDRQNSNRAPSSDQALTIWPPQSNNTQQTLSTSGEINQQITYPLPIAVEITLELEDLGRISRIIPLSSGA